MGSHWKYVLALVTIVAGVITLWLQPASTFAVHANTEVLQVRVAANQSRWSLNQVKVFLTPGPAEVLSNVSLQFDEGAIVTLERVASGPVRISLDKKGAREAATLYGPDGLLVLRLPTTATLSLEAANVPSVLPVSGRIGIGSRLTFMAEPTLALLREGKVQIVSRALLTNTALEAGAMDLYEGDFLELPADTEPSVGLIRVAETRLGVTAHSTANSVKISRFSGATVPIKASPLSRLQKDTTLQSLWAAIAAAWGFWKLFTEKKEVDKPLKRL